MTDPTSLKTLVFIPTYNENDNVTRMCEELAKLSPMPDVLFIDDNSPDGAGKTLEALAKDRTWLTVKHRPGKLGIGSAHQEGIAYAYDHGYAVLVTMDCDFTHDPADIPKLIEAAKDTHVSLGSRYMRPDSLPGWTPFRRFLTMLGHALTKNLLGLTQDASGAFRVYHLDRIPRDLFRLVTAKSYSFFFESLFTLVNNGCTVAEIPIVLTARTYGHSKLTFHEAFKSAKLLFRMSLENWAAPERFRLGPAEMASTAASDDESGWDGYWSRKADAGGLVYDLLAALYRRRVIRPNLERALAKNYAPGASLLHAGCGSGQVDVNLHRTYRVTAMDLSPAALRLYRRNNPQAAAAKLGDLFRLPFADNQFDGVYNLGVMEHFTLDEINAILVEFRRVVKPGGAITLFWPHRHATSVYVLRAAHALRRLMKTQAQSLHPPEITLLQGEGMARAILARAGLSFKDYVFGPRDFCIQAVVTCGKESA